MAARPTDAWRADTAQEAREIATGQRDPHSAVMAQLFPESLLARTDEVLAAFESEVAASSAASEREVMAAVEHAVLALNVVNDEHNGFGYETGAREELCDYIDQTLTEAGIDVEALTRRQGLTRYALTDRWRRW